MLTPPPRSPASLEDLRQQRILLLEGIRATEWALADLDAEALEHFGRGVAKVLAGDEGCSRQHVADRASLAMAWSPASREGLRDVSRAMLRACLATARRLKNGQTPADVLAHALAHDLSCKGVTLLAIADAPKTPPCPTCGKA